MGWGYFVGVGCLIEVCAPLIFTVNFLVKIGVLFTDNNFGVLITGRLIKVIVTVTFSDIIMISLHGLVGRN